MRFSVPPLRALAVAGGLAACQPAGDDGQRQPDAQDARPLPGGLDWAVAGDWRSDGERTRDAARQPVDTLDFAGLERDDVVLELWPSGGWWTAIIAPVLTAGGGEYVAARAGVNDDEPAQVALAAAFEERFADQTLFGAVSMAAFGSSASPMTAPETVDLAFTFDDVPALMALGLAEHAFAEVFTALKPDGRFLVIAPRASEQGVQDPAAATGYVQPLFVQRLASEAGFELLAQSEIGANPKDDRDHPFGVWTLEPYLLTAPLTADPNPSFDTTPFAAIGEPDRMTLLFRKPRSIPGDERAE